MAVIDLTEEVETTDIDITKSMAVATLEDINDAPEYWSVPRACSISKAYRLDFRGSDHNDRLTAENGKPLTVDAYIKKQVATSTIYCWKAHSYLVFFF